ncbi:MAG: hypothetical protein WA903_11815, partial [Ornithinimicrobium sp.]
MAIDYRVRSESIAQAYWIVWYSRWMAIVEGKGVGTERIALPSSPRRLTVAFAIFWSLFGLFSLGIRAAPDLSVGGVLLPITSFFAAAISLVPYWVNVVVTAEGVTHRPLFRTRHVPW